MCNSEWYKNQTFPIIIFQYPVPERRKLNDQGSCCYNSLWVRSLLLWDCAQQSHLVHYNSLNVPLMAELIFFFFTRIHSWIGKTKKRVVFFWTHTCLDRQLNCCEWGSMVFLPLFDRTSLIRHKWTNPSCITLTQFCFDLKFSTKRHALGTLWLISTDLIRIYQIPLDSELMVHNHSSCRQKRLLLHIPIRTELGKM